MRIRYDGPRGQIELPPHGTHKAGEIKDYPDAFGADLLATSRKQRFAAVADKPDPPASPPPATRKKGK